MMPGQVEGNAYATQSFSNCAENASLRTPWYEESCTFVLAVAEILQRLDAKQPMPAAKGK